MFPSTIPSLDLHGFDRESARLAVKEFIGDMVVMRQKEFLIIHGIGSGILRKEVSAYLKTDKRVASFCLSFMNPGCTIVTIVAQ